MSNIVGLKEFRQNVAVYADKVRGGKSFIVVKRSRPIFRVAPVENWETVVDFAEIGKGGVPAPILLKHLRHGRNPKKFKKT